MGSSSIGEQLKVVSFGRICGEPANPSSPWIESRLRYVLDFCAAVVILVCCSPLLLICSLAVWLSSPGPVFFRQRRAGQYGQEFTLYKFRSMHAGSENKGSITVRGDRRITKVGVLLRILKLDELPQLWNILRGDMAMVGPRPKLPEHEGLALLWRPGLTGAASLAFRNEEELLARVAVEDREIVYQKYLKPAKACIDSDYMAHATLSSDLEIMCKTVALCLSPWNNTHLRLNEVVERPSCSRNSPRHVQRASTVPAALETQCTRSAAAKVPITILILLILFFALSHPAQAQKQGLPNAPGLSRLDVFSGYSYWITKGSVANTPFRGSNRGIELSGAYYFDRFHGRLGAELNTKYFFNESNSSLVSASVGPIYRFPAGFGLIPFVHLLGGAADIEGPNVPDVRGQWGGTVHEEFATWGQQVTFGGGIDYTLPTLQHRIAWRILQADYLFDHVNYHYGETAKLNSGTFSTGLMFRLGSVHPAIALTCSASRAEVFPGDPLTVTAIATNLDPKKIAVYAWSGQGVPFEVQNAATPIRTKNLPPGKYVVTVRVKEGNRPNQSAICSTGFNVESPRR